MLKCSYKLKTSTITDPFTGDIRALAAWSKTAEDVNIFSVLTGYSKWQAGVRLAPQTFLWGQKASPRCKVA